MIKLKDFVRNRSKDESLEMTAADMLRMKTLAATFKYFDHQFEAAVAKELGDPMPAVFKDPTKPGPQFLHVSN